MKYRIKRKIMVTVHGFKVQRFRVLLKPSRHNLTRLPKFYGGQVLRAGLNR
jgi:hypothetical protein